MADIDPPYRFDPLQNVVDVKWGGESDDGGPVQPGGTIGVGVRTEWLFAGFVVFVFLTDGAFAEGLNPYPPLKLKGSGSGNFTGGSATGGSFGLTEPNYIPIGGGGTAGVINVMDGGGSTSGAFPYDFGGLLFTERDGHKRVFHVTGTIPGAGYDFNVGGVPRSVSFGWSLILTL